MTADQTGAMVSSSTARSRGRMDKDIQERLIQGERIVATAIIHDGIYWKPAAVFILAFLVAIFLAPELGILLAFVAVLSTAHAVIKKSILMLVITNRRVLARYGILQVDVVDMHFDKVESVELKRMVPGYIMGYSDVVIMGTGNRYIVIPYVGNGIEIRRAFNDLTLNRTAELPPIPVVVVDDQHS